jgi:hypothetical protein
MIFGELTPQQTFELRLKAVNKQPMAPYFAEALEHIEPSDTPLMDYLRRLRQSSQGPAAIDPNAAMIQRDGPSRPAPVVIQEPTKPSAHAAIAGLTQLGAVDHRFGSFRF